MNRILILLASLLVVGNVYGQTTTLRSGIQCTGECGSSGRGVLIYPSGMKYEGRWRNGYMPHGRGSLTYPDGSKYTGQWKNGKRHGQGTLIFADGDKFVGRWENNLRNGQGTYTWTSGSEYSGAWKDGLRNARGTMTYPDGSKYTGQWKNGKRHGRGTLVDVAGIKHVGRWKDGARVDQPETASNTEKSSGTGFYVNHKGHIVTNHHVVDDCKNIEVVIAREKFPASLVVNDSENDLAVLRVGALPQVVVSLRAGRSIRSGEDVLAFGYPLSHLLSEELKGSKGMINALSGPSNDSRFLQMSAPIQPGNSGGPLLDQSGNLVGVVTASLNAVKMAKHTGDIPQNVNFAIKTSLVRNMLDARGIHYNTATSETEMGTADIFDRAKIFTVPVVCWK